MYKYKISLNGTGGYYFSALIKKEVGDDISVTTPEGEKEWWINAIRYEKT